MPTVSALTIAAGRVEHLKNVIRGFDAQTEPPVEMIVGVMQETPYDDLPPARFPVRQILIPQQNGGISELTAHRPTVEIEDYLEPD